MGTGVEPCVAAAQLLHVKLLFLEVNIVAVGDLKLASRGRLYRLRDVDYLVVVEIEPCDSVFGARVPGLLLDGDGVHVLVELNHTIAFRILHRIAEQSRAFLKLRRVLQEP